MKKFIYTLLVTSIFNVVAEKNTTNDAALKTTLFEARKREHADLIKKYECINLDSKSGDFVDVCSKTVPVFKLSKPGTLITSNELYKKNFFLWRKQPFFYLLSRENGPYFKDIALQTLLNAPSTIDSKDGLEKEIIKNIRDIIANNDKNYTIYIQHLNTTYADSLELLANCIKKYNDYNTNNLCRLEYSYENEIKKLILEQNSKNTLDFNRKYISLASTLGKINAELKAKQS